MQTKQGVSNHSNNFDLLRLLFASMVVFYHMAVLSDAVSLRWLTAILSPTFAVQAFFVVSGYLVTMSFEKSSSLKEYWKKRILRLAPAYIFVVVGAAIFLSLLSELPLMDYFSSPDVPRYIFYNLLLANFKAPSLPGVFTNQFEAAVNVSLWTIKIEVMFYACVPFIVLGIRRWGYRNVLLTLFALSVAWKVGFGLLGTHYQSELYTKLAKQIPGQLAFFAGGAYLHYRIVEGLRPPWYWMIVGVALYALASGWLWDLTAPLAVTLIVAWMAFSMPKVGNVGKYGDFSFGIYLFHVPIIQSLIAVGIFGTSPWLAALLALLCTVMLAIFSWNFIEKPCLRHRSVRKSSVVVA